MEITFDLYSVILGTAVSLVFSYVPGIGDWYNRLEDSFKRLFMLGAGLVIGLAIYGLSCAGFINLVACNSDGIWKLVSIWVSFLVANQTTHKLSPRWGVKK